MPPTPLFTALSLSLAYGAPPADAPPPEEARVVVVSGAISRGSYQAGQLFMLMDHLKREHVARVDAGEPPTRLVAVGASAGSINGLISTVDVLVEPLWDPARAPEDSLYFRAWVPEGFHRSPESLDRWPEEAERYALIRTGFLDESVDGVAALIADPAARPAWTSPVRLAMTTARLLPDQGPTGLQRDVNESFAFELTRAADGALLATPLRMRCPGDAAPAAGAQPNLPCEADLAVALPLANSSGEALEADWSEIGRLIGVSAAVPVAFEPREMPCERYLSWSLWPKQSCHSVGDEAPVWMLDGGVFDGHPFRVADRVSGDGHYDGLGRVYYLDPDLGAEGPRAVDVPDPEDRALRFFGEVVPTARAQSVTQFFQDHPHLLGRVDFLRASTTPIGSYLGGFLAFYDQSFRVWDFYAGMHDGYRNLQALLLRREGIDCRAYDLGRWEPGAAQDARCEALLPSLHRDAAPAFFVVHELLTTFERAAPGSMDWIEVARRVDLGFGLIGPQALRAASTVTELGGAVKDYDRLVMLRNLRTLTLLHATRLLDLEAQADGYSFAWFANRLSSVMPCPSRGDCPPFWFVAYDLGGSLPFEGDRPASGRLVRRLARLAKKSPAKLADTFTLRQDGAFSVLFRRRVNWQLAALHRHPMLGTSPIRREVLRVGRMMVTGSNRLWSVGTGTPTVTNMPGAWGVGWDATRVKPWSAFGRHARLPWVYAGVRAYGNATPWWPTGHPNVVLSARAGVVLLQVRPGAQRVWLFDAPIAPVVGPMFPFTLETGAILQGAWVRGGIPDNLVIQPRWILPNQPALGGTIAFEARLHLMNVISVSGEWHPLSRGLDGSPSQPGHQQNPEVRVMMWFTRPGFVRPNPYRSEW
ncbi:patatin-like phospholipase family protein [Myxococcota bacterium]|nr:patatin-like phospholipase family protein [Myxococcota bacterium]